MNKLTNKYHIMDNLHYTLSYYEGEERDVSLNTDKQFADVRTAMQFISDSSLHPDYILVTEWDGEDILSQYCALYYCE